MPEGKEVQSCFRALGEFDNVQPGKKEPVGFAE
jgi:hypothetical protein